MSRSEDFAGSRSPGSNGGIILINGRKVNHLWEIFCPSALSACPRKGREVSFRGAYLPMTSKFGALVSRYYADYADYAVVSRASVPVPVPVVGVLYIKRADEASGTHKFA